MADADLIRDAYRNNLGREASDEEVNNWTSGNYGGGGVNDWLNQIRNSGEAQAYQPPTISQQQPDTNYGYDTNPQPTYDATPPPQPSFDPNAWNQVSNYYNQYLGRQGSQDEINNWLSGAYGWGNANNLSGIQQAIAGSSEAMARNRIPGRMVNDTTTAPTGTNQADWDRAVAGLSAVYRNTLGRDASPDEIQKWLKGEYGYGSGLADYNKFVNAIMSSPEARNYRGNGTRPEGQPDGYHGIEFWQSQGVPAIDIFDPMTGQLKAGWQRTATGYERVGGTTTTGTTRPIPNNDPATLIRTLLGNGPASPQALSAMESQLRQYGITLQKDSDGTVRGRLFLPNGEAVDVVNPNGWGQAWTYINRGKPGPETGRSNPNAPGNQYNDPYTRYLEELLKNRIGSLQQPVNDPARAMYEAMLKQRADMLAQATPQLDSLIKYLNERFTDLQGNGYTGAEGEALRTGALDPIETDRAAARKRVLQTLSQRGINPDSGIAQQALLEVDKQFDAMRGTAQTQLTTNDLARRESRKQRAEQIQATLAQIPEGRAREQLDVYSTLAQLSQLARSEEEARQREAVAYGGSLADLGPQRLQLAMQAAGVGGNPSSNFGNLLQLAQLNQNSALYGMQNSQSLWSGLGSIAAILSQAGR